MIRAVVLLLVAACDPRPVGYGECYWHEAALVETIEPSGEPAFACDGYWVCDDASIYRGEVYEIDGVHDLSDPADDDEAEQDRLWCDRCRWNDNPAMNFGGWPDCDWLGGDL